MLKIILLLITILYLNPSFALLNILTSADETTDNSGIITHHHHVSSSTKQAAKVAACATIGKGICLGTKAIKYAESNAKQY